jgi:hypothetical protein
MKVIFNSKKMYLFIYFLLSCKYLFSQFVPQGLMHNNNAYPATIFADASFNVNYDKGMYKPLIVSDFFWNFNNTTSYTLQFYFEFNAHWTYDYNFSIPILGFANGILPFDGISILETNKYLYYKVNKKYSTLTYNKVNYLNSVIGSKNIDNYYLNNNGYSANTGYQITTTYNGTEWKNYVNGEYINTISNDNSIWSGYGNLIIGNVTNDGFGPVFFKIDEVRFWSKALTENQIKNNWNKSLIGNEDGLKVYYNFNNQGMPGKNNSNIKYLVDLSPNKYKAKFVNTALTSEYNNYVIPINNFQLKDSLIFSFDPNNLDCYPGTGNNNNTINSSTFYDMSLKGNHLKLYNDINYNNVFTPLTNADGGRSLLMNNIYGKTNNASFISYNDRRSIEAWVKFNSLNDNSVVSIGDLADNDLFEMAVNNGKLLLNTGVDFSSNLNIKSNRTLLTNTWYHIVVVYDAWMEIQQDPKLFMIYINGAFENDYWTAMNANQISFDALFSPINTTNTTIKLGNSLRPFNGKLGILKVYKRLLSASEILNKFNATKSRFGQ